MEEKRTTSLNLRPPIVTVLGHVDHGKTTLLDYIRKTSVAEREVGGITQRIGASLVTTKEGKRITFIDTPGHATFTNMRSRGTKLADIATLIVAGEEGVKPQTREALDFILDAKIPFIVAVTKMDLPTASVENVRNQLENLGVSFEGRGGDIPLLGVSGKTGEGVEKLLETISLMSEVYSVKGSSDESLEAVVIETGKDKKGPTVSVVVRNGRIQVGQEVITENTKTKIRGIFDYKGDSVREVLPGEPALLLGFEQLPPVGGRIWSGIGEESITNIEKKPIVKKVSDGKISLILKTQTAGSGEAIIENLPTEVIVASSEVGDVTEGDIFLAKSTNSLIFAFEVKMSQSVAKLAENEGVVVETYDIVYKLFERLEEIIKKGIVEIKGKAEIIATFPYEGKKVAGCKMISGEILKTDELNLVRKDKELGKVKILSMKKGKQEIQKAKMGEEFGIFFAPQLDFQVSDVLISVRK